MTNQQSADQALIDDQEARNDAKRRRARISATLDDALALADNLRARAENQKNKAIAQKLNDAALQLCFAIVQTGAAILAESDAA